MRPTATALAAAILGLVAAPAPAAQPSNPSLSTATYADLADLADSARIVVRAQVKKVAAVEPERAPGVRPGWTRYYVEAQTQALIRGDMPLGQSLRYLVDMPPDARGKAPAIKKKVVLLFGVSVQGPAGDLQLAAPDAQVPWDTATEARTRAILAALIAPDAPGKVTGVREAIYVPGNLAGEGETQFFLDTADHSAASIAVEHRPGSPPAWGVSFSEVAASVGNPPQPNTLAWYRLACFLPNALPGGANSSEDATSRAQAEADYRMVLGELGVCERNRK
ncbi:MAG: hypothetical protein JF595_04630 [Sphingomonadales bacterium]|nr:hypothetical protein [Sphingomonadales bacterium]